MWTCIPNNRKKIKHLLVFILQVSTPRSQMSTFQSKQQGKYMRVMLLKMILWEARFTGNLHFTRVITVALLFSVCCCRYLGLSIDGNPKVFDQFVLQHRCNYFCGLLGLKSFKVIDSLSMPARAKGSKSPLLQRKKAIGSSSPQTTRKAAGSPRIPRKAEHEDKKTHSQEKDSDASREVNKFQTWLPMYSTGSFNKTSSTTEVPGWR